MSGSCASRPRLDARAPRADGPVGCDQGHDAPMRHVALRHGRADGIPHCVDPAITRDAAPADGEAHTECAPRAGDQELDALDGAGSVRDGVLVVAVKPWLAVIAAGPRSVAYTESVVQTAASR